MENTVMEDDSVISEIKRRVKDKRISRTKLNVSLASKIKTKIINNSSIFKISLKHNNRALAQALSREKENSRRITTEKMLLQKEVEKLNFENTFLRLKLNNLNKKLIEIESLVNNNLITAIEMSSLSEFNQSSFLLPASKKKRISKKCNLKPLPFARVPLTSNDDDEDDDGGHGKQKAQCDSGVIPRTSPNISSALSPRRPSLSPQCDLKVLLPKEDNQSLYGLEHSEHTSSIVDLLPNESPHHTEQSSKSSLVSEMKITLSTSPRRKTSSLSNVTERKKRGSSWESKNPIANAPCVTELNWNNEKNACLDGNYSNMHMDRQCSPARDPDAKCMNDALNSDNFQLHKTVYEAVDMELTATDTSKIVTVSKGIKTKGKNKPNCDTEAFRKVKDLSSGKERKRSKKKCTNSSDVDIEEKTENEPERGSIVIDDKTNLEDSNFIFNTEQQTQANKLQKITLQNGFDHEEKQYVQCSKKKKQIHVTNEQEETDYFSQVSNKFLQESKLDKCQNSLTCNDKSKASRQTFVIHQLEKDNLFLNSKDEDTISKNLEVANEFQAVDLFTKDNENSCDYETQNMLDFKKYITDIQPVPQNKSKVTKLKQKIIRRTKIISKVNQIYEDDDENVHGPEKDNNFHLTQVNNEMVSGDPEVSKEFRIPIPSTKDHRNLSDCKTHNVLGLQNQIIDMYAVQQNESKINKNFRQKVNRKTEIISEANDFNNDKGVQLSEKDYSLFPLEDKKVIFENLKGSNDFHTPALGTKDGAKLCDYKTQTVCGVKKHAHDMQPACQNDAKIDAKLTQKVHRKTLVISAINQAYESDHRGVPDPEKDHFFSLTRKNKETSSENKEVAHEFQTIELPTKDHGNKCDHKTQNISDLQKHVTNVQLPQPGVSKLNQKLRQKVSMTKIISEMNNIYVGIDELANGQDCTNNLDFKIDKSKKVECQDFVNGYCMGIDNNEKESCDQVPDPYKPVKKQRKKSIRAKDTLTKKKNKPILQMIDCSQTSVALESSLKHITNEANSNSGNQTKHPKKQKRNTVTLNTQRDVLFEDKEKEGNCPAQRVSKVKSKSQTKKTVLDLPLDAHKVVELMPDTAHKKPVDSEQTDKENYLENENIVQEKPDCRTKMFKPLSQIRSPNIQNSSFDRMPESLIPLSISSSKNLMMEEKFSLANSPVFQVSEGVHEKMKEGNCKVKRKAQKSSLDKGMLKDLTDTSLVSKDIPKFDTVLEDPSLELSRRKRKCAPVNLKEPSLTCKMRR